MKHVGSPVAVFFIWCEDVTHVTQSQTAAAQGHSTSSSSWTQQHDLIVGTEKKFISNLCRALFADGCLSANGSGLKFNCLIVYTSVLWDKSSSTEFDYQNHIYTSINTRSVYQTFHVWSYVTYLHAAVYRTHRCDLMSAVSPDAATEATDHQPLVFTVKTQWVVVLRTCLQLSSTWNTHFLSGWAFKNMRWKVFHRIVKLLVYHM